MLRQASNRNHRSKGFKIKNALQIFILVAICIWLLYQVKHSHEKKRAFEERNSQSFSKVVENEPDFFRFGRKDLPHIEPEETGSVNEVRDREVENEETQEKEERETKHEDIEDEEGKDNGDEEIEVQDEEKVDEEAEHEEESTEEEEDKGTHDGEEDKDEKDEVDLFDSQNHEGGTQEAREENYRRDDASSAVAHESGNGDEKSVEEDRVVNKVDDNTTTKSGWF